MLYAPLYKMAGTVALTRDGHGYTYTRTGNVGRSLLGDNFPSVAGAPTDYGSFETDLYGLGIRRQATIFSWARPVAVAGGYLYVLSDWNTNVGTAIRIESLSGVTWYVYPNNHRITATVVPNLSLNTSCLITCIMDGAVMRLFVNGVQMGVDTALAEDVGDSASPLRVGAQGSLLDNSQRPVIVHSHTVYPRPFSFHEQWEWYQKTRPMWQ